MSERGGDRSALGALAVAGAACLWGLWGLAVRQAGVGGPVAACIALTTIALVGAPLLPRRLPRGREVWTTLALIGVADAGNALLYFVALERGPLAVAVLSHYLAPLLVAALSPALLGAWPRPRTLLALPVSLLGLALLLGEEALALGGAAVTALFGAGSALFYALNVVLSKRLVGRLAPAEVLIYHAAFSAVLLLPFALGGPAPDLRGVLWVVGAASLCGVLAGWVFLWGLGRLPAARAGVLTYLEPVVGVLIGTAVMGETMATWAPAGALLVVGAGIVVVRDSGEPGGVRG